MKRHLTYINASLKKDIRSRGGRKLGKKAVYSLKKRRFLGIQPPKSPLSGGL